MKYYAGIGSRETPSEILELMGRLAAALYNRGYTLRSGGAPGADQAFEWGVWRHAPDAYHAIRQAEIYLPWAKFELDNRTPILATRMAPQDEAFEIAEQYHPRWKYLNFAAKKFHARNVHQIYGEDVMNPDFSEFIVCWTKNAKGSGGTGQAIRIADDLGIPVYDLANNDNVRKFWLKINGSFVV